MLLSRRPQERCERWPEERHLDVSIWVIRIGQSLSYGAGNNGFSEPLDRVGHAASLNLANVGYGFLPRHPYRGPLAHIGMGHGRLLTDASSGRAWQADLRGAAFRVAIP